MLSSVQVDRDALAPAGVWSLLSKPTRQADLFQAISDSVDALADGDGCAPDREAHAEPAGPVVLVAEDNEVNGAVAKALLARRDLRTEVAVNGKEAVRMSQVREYAAILMDCQMPELDGYQATRRIRELEADAHVPIIAMTAHSMAGDRERCLAAGMDDYLAKPVRANELDAAIERWLPGHTWGEGAQTTGPLDEFIDAATVAQLRETLPSEMRARLIATFEKSLPEVLAEIEKAARDGDTAGVHRAAHMLKGSSAMLGAPRLTSVCRRLEHTRACDVAIFEADLEELRFLAATTSDALRRELVDHGSPSSAPSASVGAR
jgi:CheY-like chemotaxis protein/HPt (histidine-containing phosphotransfer) domain-containing protein